MGYGLRLRYDRTGHVTDLDEAVAFGRRAVGAPDRARCQTNLSGAPRVRFDRVGALADLDESVAVGWAAVEATPVGHATLPKYLLNLAGALGAGRAHRRPLGPPGSPGRGPPSGGVAAERSAAAPAVRFTTCNDQAALGMSIWVGVGVAVQRVESMRVP
ncbi:hypothetical protein AB0H83_51040 [Dactylosporangium sp. NPDC050688]|uniref:hypothetical protein n=1 Tax=Dactylosporangium sp. NPDC050688 TaxID=3157217 RepID=UPI0033DE3406